jgi:hypothetical protein
VKTSGQRLRIATLLLALVPLAALAAANPFARVDEDADGGPRALQLAITSYVPAGQESVTRVDLIAAIHIGDAAYYAELNRRFTDYDSLLYELIAPADSQVPGRIARRPGILSGTQVGMTKLLGLSFQLDEIHYDRANFVHADLTPDELKKSMAERNETLYVYFWRIFFASIDQYAKDPLGIRDLENLSSVFAGHNDWPLKTVLAYEMTDMDAMRSLLGEDAGSAIIGARNQRAIEVLQERLAAGDRHIGIFYGVAHMPDLEAKLTALGFVRADTVWIDAWQLASEP